MVLLERFPLRRRLSDVVKNCFGIDSTVAKKRIRCEFAAKIIPLVFLTCYDEYIKFSFG